MNPTNDQAYYKRGEILKKLEKYKYAVGDYSSALLLKPD